MPGGAPDWTKVGYKKNRKYTCLASAIDALSKGSVVTSWARTGITKALTGVQPQHKDRKTGLLVEVPIVFDDYVALGAEEGALEALADFGGDEGADVVEGVAVHVPLAAHVARSSAVALAALAPPPPKPKVGRPKVVPQRPAGTPDIRQFFPIPKKRDRDDDDGFKDDMENLRE